MRTRFNDPNRAQSRYRRRVIGLVASAVVSSALLGLALAPVTLYADELKVLGNLNVQASGDTNPLLQVGTTKNVFIGTVSPSLQVLSRSDRLQYNLSAGADLRGYGGWDRDFTDSERASISGTYLTTERSRLGLNASVDRVTILDALEDNTGKFTVPARVTTASISPSVYYLLDPVDELDFSGYFSDRSYNSPQLIDYQEYGASFGLTRTLSETDKLAIHFTGEHTEPQISLATKTDIISATLSWGHELAGGLVATLSGGPVLIRRRLPTGFGTEPDQWGYQATVSFYDPIDELTSVAVDFNQRATPTGVGGVGQRYSAHVGLQRKLTPLLSLAIDGHYTHSISHGLNVDNLDTLYDAGARFDWQLNDVSKVSLGYYYRDETFRTVAGHASSNSVILSLSRSFGRVQ